MVMVDLSIIILTYNEAIHVERAIRSVTGLAKNIFVVDSFSTDSTVTLSKALGATVVEHEFVNYAKQFQWALDSLPIATDWIMRLDADEFLTDELIEEIRLHLPHLSEETTGVVLKLGYIFQGQKIEHGGRWLQLLRIIRTGKARIQPLWMDEHMVLLGGSAVPFAQKMYDANLKDLTFFTDKHNKYATREAIDRLNQERRFLVDDTTDGMGRGGRQSRLKQFVKQRLYNKLPFGVGPLFYFLWRYFVLLGFLDGREGLIYHVLQGFWYRFLVEAKVRELQHAVSHLHDPREIKAELARLTGLALD
jgi:glycosyltransferase involved in cell wall biosynthesis